MVQFIHNRLHHWKSTSSTETIYMYTNVLEMNFFCLTYPFEVFSRVHYSMQMNPRRKITGRKKMKRASCSFFTRWKENDSRKNHCFLSFTVLIKTEFMSLQYTNSYLHFGVRMCVCIETYTHFVNCWPWKIAWFVSVLCSTMRLCELVKFWSY